MINIPDFSDGYFLPPGEHVCTIEEIEAKFLDTKRREKVWGLFKSFLNRLSFFGIIPEIMLIDGSFVTGREEPGDVDVCFYIKPQMILSAFNNISNNDDKISLKFILNSENQLALRLAFGVHPMIVPNLMALEICSDLFRTGGNQFKHQLKGPDLYRDPNWVKIPQEKGILKVFFNSQGGLENG